MLRIGDLDIRKLSGPVSFRYLVPKTEVFMQKAAEGIFLPIIMLWGDRHKSEDDQCDDNSVAIDSSVLWRRIDRLAKKYPIDFYIEAARSNLLSEYDSPLAVGMLPRMMFRSMGCYDTKQRASNKFSCLHRNVRWHIGEPRQWGDDKLESVVSQVIRLFGRILKGDHQDVLGGVTTGLYLFRDFFSIMIESYNKGGTLDQLALSLASSFSSYIVGNSESLIYKQLKKYKLDVNVELYSYRSIIGVCRNHMGVDPMTYTLKKVIDSKVEDADGALDNLYRNIFDVLLRSMIDDNYFELVKLMRTLWIVFTGFFLDLYFIGRMFKTPKDNVNSYLSIGFFGDAHSTQIADTLTNSLGWYDEVKGVPEKLRCMTFPVDINLSRDLEEYAEMRQHVQDITPFRDRSELEEQLWSS